MKINIKNAFLYHLKRYLLMVIGYNLVMNTKEHMNRAFSPFNEPVLLVQETQKMYFRNIFQNIYMQKFASISWYCGFSGEQIFELEFIMELALWLFASFSKVLG